MNSDVSDLQGFYAGPLGQVTHRLLARAVGRIWPDLRGLSVLGLGYAPPLLADLAPSAERALAFMPAAQGVIRWPRSGLSRSALADPDCLPVPDGCVDRVLVVHGLETAESPGELLSEVARVMTPAGRVLLICPNRRGIWARTDATPFGQGQPFSRKQLRRLMRAALLAPERWEEALYLPPLTSRLVLRSASAWESLGAAFALPFAGVHLVEATKQLYRPVPIRIRRRVAVEKPIFVPLPASRESTM